MQCCHNQDTISAISQPCTVLPNEKKPQKKYSSHRFWICWYAQLSGKKNHKRKFFQPRGCVIFDTKNSKNAPICSKTAFLKNFGLKNEGKHIFWTCLFVRLIGRVFISSKITQPGGQNQKLTFVGQIVLFQGNYTKNLELPQF